MKLNQFLNLAMTLCVITFFSCEKEGVSPEEEKMVNQQADIPGEGPATGACSIAGARQIDPGGTATYTFSNNFPIETIVWTVPSNVSIISGQNTSSLTVRFNSRPLQEGISKQKPTGSLQKLVVKGTT